MKIYISGLITGLPIAHVVEKFADTVFELEAMGYETVNPLTLHGDLDKTWKQYMVTDIEALFDCDGIYMQKDWQQSKGAQIEYHIARILGLKTIFENQPF